MATFLGETEWHESAGYGPTSYAWSFFDGNVTSPYYKDGRQVPTYQFAVTRMPFEGIPTVAFTATSITLGVACYPGTVLGAVFRVENSVDSSSEEFELEFAFTGDVALTPTQGAAQAVAVFNPDTRINCSNTAGVINFIPQAPWTSVEVLVAWQRLP